MRILATLTALVLALPAQAEIPIRELSRYLNSFATAQAEFTQINADGSISTGDLAMQRPGRARFDYDAPNDGLVLAGGGQIAIFDPKSNTPPEQYPLAQTPLSIILDDRVSLRRSGTVLSHSGDATQTTLTLRDPRRPLDGNIQLVFTPNPTTLRQWVITDEAGTQTTVILGDMQTGVSFQPSTFSIQVEAQRRGLGN